MMQGRRTSDKLVIFGSVAALVVVIVLMIFLINLASNLVEALLPLVAGTLLLLANRAALMEFVRVRKASPAMTNAVIGLGLLFFGLGKTVGGESWLRVLFYLPGFVLMLMALPLALGRNASFDMYRKWGANAVGAGQRVWGARRSRPGTVAGSFNRNAGQPTVQLDPTTINQAEGQKRP
jgi:hypothetical protein